MNNWTEIFVIITLILHSSDPVDGVLKIESEFLNDKRITVQLVCSFRYGREVRVERTKDFNKVSLLTPYLPTVRC